MTKNDIDVRDFLTPGVAQIRKSIHGIDDSYNHDWDILAELCQNAVDAIRASKRQDGKITIEVDARNRTIAVEDNGIGIEADRLATLLGPFSTSKEDDDQAIGEKGVGLTFALFSCNDFTIKTGTRDGAVKGSVKGALSWKSNFSEEKPDIDIAPIQGFVGTKVRLHLVDESNKIFDWSKNQLLFVLRTRTAIGSTRKIWGDEENIDVILKYHASNGEQWEVESVPFRYLTPDEELTDEVVVDLMEFEEWARNADRTDQEKRRKLQDKVITFKNEYIHGNNRPISVYACFVPSRESWNIISRNANLVGESELENSEWLQNFSYLLHSSGIYTSVKGMPTGVEIKPPSTGLAGYWSNIFMIFEDENLKFDIGRKSIHGRQGAIYRKYAHKVFNEYSKYIVKYVSGDVDAEYENWNKDAVFDEIDLIPDLDFPKYAFHKTPKDQEASVVALFFEAIGRGDIQGIVPLISGYRHKYDLYAKVDSRRVVVEFKSRLKNLLKDFNSTRKMFDELDAVVVWDVSEDDVEEFKREGISLKPLESGLHRQKAKFPHATHELMLPNVRGVSVIDLKMALAATSQ